MNLDKQFYDKLDLKEKVSIITGGASGIGLSTAQLFAHKGAKVIIIDLKENTQNIAKTLNCDALGIRADITDIKQILDCISIILNTFGKIDILCNIAGIGHSNSPENIEEEEWKNVINVNLSALFFISQKVGEVMIRQRSGGKIVNMASQAGIVAIQNHVAYSASKAGVIAITRALALDWGKYDINVNAISPTVVLTPMAIDYWIGERADSHLKQIPKGRFVYPEEVAYAVFYLASSASDMINGANLVMDGGFTSVRS